MGPSVEPFLGEIGIVGFTFAPYQWAQCQGQLLSISQYSALFSLLGTTYGGNGTTNFNLPNLQGRVPIGIGQGPGLSNHILGETSGSATISLTQTQMPLHNHGILAYPVTGLAPATANAVGSVPAASPAFDALYGNTPATNAMAPATITLDAQTALIGSSQPHNNMQPFLVLNYVIALGGIYPARS